MMRELRVTTTQGADTGLEDTVVEAYKASLRGALLRPGDVDYEDTRKIHSGALRQRAGPAYAHRGRTHGRCRQPDGSAGHRLQLPRRTVQLPHRRTSTSTMSRTSAWIESKLPTGRRNTTAWWL